MNKEELEKLIKAAEYCIWNNCNSDCPLHECDNCLDEYASKLVLPYFKELYELKYSEIDTTNDEDEEGELYLKPQIKNKRSCKLVLDDVIDTTKELTTGQMIDFLANNSNSLFACVDCDTPVELSKNGLVWKTNNKVVNLYDYIDSKWELIPPKPIEVKFREAYKAYYHKDLKVKSMVTERIFSYKNNHHLEWATDKEIDGEWEIID